jgi:Protein of unknown function (DUF2917)
MNRVQHFELHSLTAARFYAEANCVIRVTSGQVWLTVEGHLGDAWLAAGAEHAVKHGTVVWLSAEPSAAISVVYAPVKVAVFGEWIRAATRIARAPLLVLRRAG